MIVDGYTTQIKLDGTFAAAIQWQAFALDKLRLMIQSGFRGLRVMEIGDVKLRVWLDPSSKQAKVWVEATDVKHGIVGILMTTEHPRGEVDPKTGRPTYKRLLIAMERPKGADAGVPKAPVRKAIGGVATTDGSAKYGAWDWVYQRPVEGQPDTYRFVGYLTWGERTRFSGMNRGAFSDVRVTNASSLYGVRSSAGDRIWLNRKMVLQCPVGPPMAAAIKHIRNAAGERKYLLVLVLEYVYTAYETAPALYAVDITQGFDSDKGAAEWTAKATRLAFLSKAVLGLPEAPNYEQVRFRFNQSATRCSGVIPAPIAATYFGVGYVTTAVVHIDLNELTARVSRELPNTTAGVTQTYVPEVYGGSSALEPVEVDGLQLGFTGSVTNTFTGAHYETAYLPQGGAATLFIDYDGDDERRYTAELVSYLSATEYVDTAWGKNYALEWVKHPGPMPGWHYAGHGDSGDTYYTKQSVEEYDIYSRTIPHRTNLRCEYRIGAFMEADEQITEGDVGSASAQPPTGHSSRFFWLSADPRYGHYAGYRILYDATTATTTYQLVIDGEVVSARVVAEPAAFTGDSGNYLLTYAGGPGSWQDPGVVTKARSSAGVTAIHVLYALPRQAYLAAFTRGATVPYTERGGSLGVATHATDAVGYDATEPQTFVNLCAPAFDAAGPSGSAVQWVTRFGEHTVSNVLDTTEHLPRLGEIGLI